MPLVDAVVFDLFHTLIDPEPLYPPGFDKRGAIAAAAGVEREPLVAYWDETYIERETTTIDLVDLIDRHCISVGRPMSASTRETVDEILGVAVDEAVIHPHPRIVDLVAKLAGRVPVGVLSNCHEREIRLWSDGPLAEHTRAFGASSRIGAMKPDPAAYAWIIDQLGLDPAASCYVGNGGSDELAGARNAGFGTVVHCNVFDRHATLVSPAEQRRRALDADVSCDDIDHLCTAITQLVIGAAAAD